MRSPRLFVSLVAGVVVGIPVVASAHIHLTSPRHRTDAPTGDQKEQHCGTPGWVRADHPDRIAYYLPGETITVAWDETIQHPGYFRISFQPEGETFQIPLCGDGSLGPTCPSFPVEDLTGTTDPGTGALILADRIVDGTLSQSITLPSMECANCTLQFIQVMTDKPPYTRDALSDDIYFNCTDIVLSNSPPPSDARPSGDAGGNPAADADPGGGGTTGGCSTSGSEPSGILTALSLVWLLRRRTFRRA